MQWKFKKFNYLKYKPANDKALQPNETVVQQCNSKLSYANANNTTDSISERPTQNTPEGIDQDHLPENSQQSQTINQGIKKLQNGKEKLKNLRI